jgi:hypothetical protein
MKGALTAFKRISKYEKKGYHIDNKERLKILRHWDSVDSMKKLSIIKMFESNNFDNERMYEYLMFGCI